MLYREYADSKQSADAFESLADLVLEEATPPIQPDGTADAPSDATEETEPQMTPAEKYAAVYEQNSDFVGWITIDGTNINYPVMQTPDNPNFYLKHSFEKNYSNYGVPYVQENCTLGASDNVIIYGHHMNDGSMFANLCKYESEDFYREHKTIRFDTLSDYGEYEIVTVLKFIGQIMTSKSPVRSAEDVDEQALSYAEIKALATGNPYIKEKMDLDVSVSKLKLLKQNHLSQRYALEDKVIKFYPAEIRRYENIIEGYQSDIQTAQSQSIFSEDGFSAMTVEDVTYTDKKAAGTAILEACKAMTSPDPKRIGDYRGFYLELSFDKFEKQYQITLVGMLRHTVPLGTDIHGNITRLDNFISSLPDKQKAAEELLENTEIQFENAKEQIEKPFPQEEELKAKSARLAELNSLLDMDHMENEVDVGEVDVADGVSQRVRNDVVR